MMAFAADRASESPPQPWRWAVFAAGLALLAWLGWQVWRAIAADQAADRQQWTQALQWRPLQPRAVLGAADAAMGQDRLDQAAASLRTLVAQEPLEGGAYRRLAQIAARRGEAAASERLYAVAVRRGPRDLPARAWAIQHALEQGRTAEALSHVDALLRLSPRQGEVLLPLLAQMAVEPAFAQSLADTLEAGVPWRTAMLRQLTASDGQAAGLVLGAMHRHRPLPSEEFDQWIGWLMERGQWSEAYGYWAGRAAQEGGRLPLAYNGDFGRMPANTGFDWRLRASPGTTTRFEPDVRGGHVARLEFGGRSVERAELELPLLLGPGDYRLQLRQRAARLRSEQGLQWQLSCAQGGAPIATIDGIDGSFDWRQASASFTVPSTGCAGQWLRLVNPLPKGRAQHVAGQLWIDDVQVEPRR